MTDLINVSLVTPTNVKLVLVKLTTVKNVLVTELPHLNVHVQKDT
jgi:hypothetical protein